MPGGEGNRTSASTHHRKDQTVSDEYDDMTTEDLFTSDELAAMDLGDELHQDAIDEARDADEGN